MKRFLALLLCLAFLLSGCIPGPEDFTVTYEEMVYEHPNLSAYDQCVAESCEIARTSDDIGEVEDAIWALYDAYDAFYTNYNLAYIHYCADLTDIYWEDEYAYCESKTAEFDAGLEELYRSLAQSPIRAELESDEYFGHGFFDSYEGESLYDETFLSLLEREAELMSEYYAISNEAMDVEYYSDAYFDTYEPLLGQNLVDLIEVRQQIADYVGYDSYPQFAYDFYYYRDYSPAQALALCQSVKSELVPLYKKSNTEAHWELGGDYCDVDETYAYVADVAAAMGGNVAEAFSVLDAGSLYDMRTGENRYDISFEVFLDSYFVPFIFVNPWEEQMDKLTFAHEFGHFANDYMCGGSYSGVDVSEVFSQGMEYLSLCYGGEELEQAKLVDNLYLYAEQSAYAMFEHQVYDLRGDDLTVENVRNLYKKICTSFGFESWSWDSRDYVTITHFYVEPMYIISYVVSNDVAFQLYQLEKQTPGAGLEVFQSNLSSEESYIISFAESIGLESPFAPGRMQAVRSSLEEVLP